MISVNLINTLKLRQMWFATWQIKSLITCDLAFIKWFMVLYIYIWSRICLYRQ